MSVLKRRSRMISLRLSEDEYASLKTLCVNNGARSVSDLARDALQRLLVNRVAPHSLESTVHILQIRIEALDLEVRRLAMALNSHRPAAPVVSSTSNGDD